MAEIGTRTSYSPGMVSMTSQTPEFNLGGGSPFPGAPNQLMALLQERLKRSLIPQQPSKLGRNNTSGGTLGTVRDAYYAPPTPRGMPIYTQYTNVANAMNGPVRASGPGPGVAFGGYAPVGAGVQNSSFSMNPGPSRASLPMAGPEQAGALEGGGSDDWYDLPEFQRRAILEAHLYGGKK